MQHSVALYQRVEDVDTAQRDFGSRTRGRTENLSSAEQLCEWQHSAQNSDLPTQFPALPNSLTVYP